MTVHRDYRDILIERKAQLESADAPGKRGPIRVRLGALEEDGDPVGVARTARQAQLQKIEAALKRLDAGRYGTCMFCKGAIDARRLHDHPETELCRRCSGS